MITLDLRDCKYIMEIHQRIQNAFEFPDWYGANWSAFWDFIREPRTDTIVEVRGLYSLPKSLENSGEKIVEILERNKQYYKLWMASKPEINCGFDYKIID